MNILVENSALLGLYPASNSNFLRTFWVDLSVPSPGITEDGTDSLSRNVGKKLLLLAA